MLLVSDSLLSKNEFHHLLEFHHLSFYKKNFKYKNPYLAGSLSAALPGLGKFYTSSIKKMLLLPLLYVGVTTFQGIRGFKKNGIKVVTVGCLVRWHVAFILEIFTDPIISSFKKFKNKRQLNEAVNRIYN